MHNTIYQITSAPVAKDEYLSDIDFIEHWFVGSIADRVDSDINRSEELKSFRDLLENKQIAFFNTDDSFTIQPGGKEIYFKNKYMNFIEAANKASKLNLDDFTDDAKCSDIVQQIKDSYCEKYGDYVSSDEFDTIPFDEFIRRAEPKTQYYIGGIIDFHW